MAIGSSTTALSPLQVVATGTIVRLGEQSGTTGKQFLIGIDGTAGRTELQSVWQGTGFTSLALQPSGGNVLIGTTTDSGARLQVITTSTNAAIQVTLPSNANATILQSYSSNSGFGWKIQQDEVSTGDFRIFRRESSVDYQVLNFSRSSGAATFSSSVTAVGNINIQDSSLLNLGYNQGGGATLKYNSNGNLDITPRSGYNTNFTSGNVEFGTTGLNGRLGIYYGLTSKVGIDMRDSDDASNAYFLFFRKSNGTGIGSIQRAGLTDATLYNTTSDYRLKEDFKQINGLDKISKIKVYDFKWKGLEDRMDGVIAHELQEIMPYAVSGQKDGENMQAVDYSKIVPILVKAIQEQQAQIEELSNKIVALESK
jgi:hypothetical protein